MLLILSILKHWVEFTVKLSGPGLFFVGRILNTESASAGVIKTSELMKELAGSHLEPQE